MCKSKVSIIMPCYNGEKTIEQAIMGVVNQTYRPIEFILVNDGSTDNSDNVIKNLENKIKNARIEFKYVVQENRGLGGAIDTGLKYVTGEYLAWIDADDELVAESVEKRVAFLETHPDFGSVSSNAVTFRVVNGKEETLELATQDIKSNSEENQFENMLLRKSLFCAGSHLVRTEVFKESHNGMEIYPARHGQNWQMLLPVYYCSKHGFINEALYKYRVGDESMTSKVLSLSLKDFYKKQNEYIELVEKTINQINGMPNKERRKYIFKFKKFVYALNLDAANERNSKYNILKWKAVVRFMNVIDKIYF